MYYFQNFLEPYRTSPYHIRPAHLIWARLNLVKISPEPKLLLNPFKIKLKTQNSFLSVEGRGREMDPKLTEVSQLFERFKAACTRDDLNTSTNLLSQLKVTINLHTLKP